MIKIGNKYMIFKPRKFVTQKGDTVWSFSVGDSSFNKETKQYDNNGFINISTFADIELEDRQKVEFSEILGASVNKYTNKSGIEISTVVVSVKLKEEGQGENGEYVEAQVQDLPF